MALNDLNKASENGDGGPAGNFTQNDFQSHFGAIADNVEGEKSDPKILTELEKMAAKELQQRIDEGKRTWKLQSQLTLLWQRSVEETERAIRRKVEQFRNSVRTMDKNKLLERRYSAAATAGGSPTVVTTHSVNYYRGGSSGQVDKVGILLDGEKLELTEFGEICVWSSNPSSRFNNKREEKEGKGKSKGNDSEEDGCIQEEEDSDDTEDETERMIK